MLFQFITSAAELSQFADHDYDFSVDYLDILSSERVLMRLERGLGSYWDVMPIDDDRFLVEVSGRRHSLGAWCPHALYHLAKQKWLQGDFVKYETLNRSVHPCACDVETEDDIVIYLPHDHEWLDINAYRPRGYLVRPNEAENCWGSAASAVLNHYKRSDIVPTDKYQFVTCQYGDVVIDYAVRLRQTADVIVDSNADLVADPDRRTWPRGVALV